MTPRILTVLSALALIGAGSFWTLGVPLVTGVMVTVAVLGLGLAWVVRAA